MKVKGFSLYKYWILNRKLESMEDILQNGTNPSLAASSIEGKQSGGLVNEAA